ncbi:transposase, Ptta/En/Spm, transposase, Tnp1/En/Spm-like protein [Tanacetum coccineum]
MTAHGGRNNIIARRVIDYLIDISGEKSPPLNALITELETSSDYEEVFDLVMELRDDMRDEQDKVADFTRLIAIAEEKIHGKEIDLEMLEAEGNDAFALVCEALMCLIRIVVGNAVSGFWFEDSILERWIQKQDDNFGMEITRYFDVDLTVKKLVMNRLGQLLRNFRRKLRQTYILPNQNTLSKLNEVPAKYSAILQAEEWVNFVKYTTTEEYKVKSAKAKMARSKCVFPHTMGRGGYALVKEKMKETEDKIKEGTLKVDHGTDAMTFVLGKEKGGYARGVGSGVTYKRYFDLPQSRQASDERILLLQSQLDNERRERQEKELLIQNLSNKMSQTEGMVTTLKNQLATQGGQFQSMSTQLTPPNVSPVDINPINSSAYEEGGTTVVGCENDASIQKSNGLATLEKEMETRTDGKQMLHNKGLPKDCYKVSIDTSLVDAACIPDVGNNGFKTVKDAVGGFFAWPKDQVVFDPKATPPSTIQMNVENKTAPKLHTKRKNVYVSSDAMQRQAKKKSLQKSLNY